MGVLLTCVLYSYYRFILVQGLLSTRPLDGHLLYESESMQYGRFPRHDSGLIWVLFYFNTIFNSRPPRIHGFDYGLIAGETD